MSLSDTFRKNRMSLSDPRHTTSETQHLHTEPQQLACIRRNSRASEQRFLDRGAWQRMLVPRGCVVLHHPARTRSRDARARHAAPFVADQPGYPVALDLGRVGPARVELLVAVDEVWAVGAQPLHEHAAHLP